jgi:AraC-like DNA-binding protein
LNDDYHPLQHGIQKELHDKIIYIERKPSDSLRQIVSCYWLLRVTTPLQEPFTYTVMPDTCIDIVFDVNTPSDPLIMTPHLTIEELLLGHTFHYVGIRLLPGTFASQDITPNVIVGRQHNIHNIGAISLDQYDSALRRADDDEDHFLLLDQLANELHTHGLARQNKLMRNVITGLQFGISQEEIARKVGYSSRQLRRIVREQTGFSPMQLQRILRFQLALSNHDTTLRFADQSHLIKEFKRFTGTTYSTFKNKF